MSPSGLNSIRPDFFFVISLATFSSSTNNTLIINVECGAINAQISHETPGDILLLLNVYDIYQNKICKHCLKIDACCRSQ